MNSSNTAQLSEQQISAFQDKIYHYYKTHKRDFLWRNSNNPYNIVVSEIMLQQTQTYRVAPKYEQFITAFPTFNALAQASLHDVLTQWQGLGYNRRGQALHLLAQIIVQEFNGVLPNDPEILVTLPGIGKATAGSICAFAFNLPTVFIETNIRAVFINHFFPLQGDIKDTLLLPLIAETLDSSQPREWYYALMDYGVMLKKTLPNPSRKSAHHTVQSKFEGSERQVRGMIIRAFIKHKVLTLEYLFLLINRDPQRIERNLAALCKEKIITVQNDLYSLE